MHRGLLTRMAAEDRVQQVLEPGSVLTVAVDVGVAQELRCGGQPGIEPPALGDVADAWKMLRHDRLADLGWDLAGSLDRRVVLRTGELLGDQCDLTPVGGASVRPLPVGMREKLLDPLFDLLARLRLGWVDELRIAVPQRHGDRDRRALLVLDQRLIGDHRHGGLVLRQRMVVTIEDRAAQAGYRSQRALLRERLGRKLRGLEHLNLDGAAHHDHKRDRGQSKDQPQTPVAEPVHPGLPPAGFAWTGARLGAGGLSEKKSFASGAL